MTTIAILTALPNPFLGVNLPKKPTRKPSKPVKGGRK